MTAQEIKDAMDRATMNMSKEDALAYYEAVADHASMWADNLREELEQ